MLKVWNSLKSWNSCKGRRGHRRRNSTALQHDWQGQEREIILAGDYSAFILIVKMNLGGFALFIVNFNSKKKKFRYKIFQYKQTGLLWKAIPELYANGIKSSIYLICLVWSLWVFATNATSGKKYRCLIEISLIGKYQTDFCIPWLPAQKGKDILPRTYLSTAPAIYKQGQDF